MQSSKKFQNLRLFNSHHTNMSILCFANDTLRPMDTALRLTNNKSVRTTFFTTKNITIVLRQTFCTFGVFVKISLHESVFILFRTSVSLSFEFCVHLWNYIFRITRIVAKYQFVAQACQNPKHQLFFGD